MRSIRLVGCSAAVLLAVGALGGLSGCGGSPPGAISAPAAARLHRDVEGIRRDAASGSAVKAHAALDGLRRDIAGLLARGQIAPADAHVLLIDAGQVNERIAVEVKPVASVPPPQSVPTTPAAPSGPAGDGNGNGRGKGDGHGGHGGD